MNSRLGIHTRNDNWYLNTPTCVSYHFGKKQANRALRDEFAILNKQNKPESFVSLALDYYKPIIFNKSVYYPFGSSIANRTWSDVNRQYRYGFQGKEKDFETANDNYDFGARIYDGRLGRWLSLDPLMKEFSFVSCYGSMNNSPISIIDIKGERIVIYYEVPLVDANGDPVLDPETGEPMSCTHSFEYKPGLTPPDNEFAKKAVEALDYVYNNSRKGKREIRKAILHKDPLKIVETNGDNIFHHSRVDNETNRDKIMWNPDKRLALFDNQSPFRYITGYSNSPAMGLIHEILHFNHEKQNPDWFFGIGAQKYSTNSSWKKRGYTKPEERRTIRQERRIANQLGERKRYNHRGEYISANSVIDASALTDQEAIQAQGLYSSRRAEQLNK